MTKNQGALIGLLALTFIVVFLLYDWSELQNQFSTQRIAPWRTDAGPWAPLLFIGGCCCD